MNKQIITQILSNYFSNIFYKLSMQWMQDNQAEIELLIDGIIELSKQAALEELRKENTP